jgi:hypothetical protein
MVYREGKKDFSNMKRSQQGRLKKQIKEIMEYLRVEEYTVGPQKNDHAGAAAQERA